ncbi:hypothetical protein C8R44DRAFT_739463 [Mycena epipterygia]|nr:hypothetical protein C8R44DRAFT_739463 [Mycena epipterygia]
MAAINSLADYFFRGEKQNGSLWKNHCKACVTHHMQSAGAPMSDIITQGPAYTAGSVLSRKEPRIAHLIGGKTPCAHASAEAKADATAQRKEFTAKKRTRSDDVPEVTQPPPKKQQYAQSTLTAGSFRRNDMPFSPSEADAFQAQALRAVISSGIAFRAFEDPEMKVLFGMIEVDSDEEYKG